jgi:hypothetical protein
MDYHADKIIDLYERHAQDYGADWRRVRWNESAFSAEIPKVVKKVVTPPVGNSDRLAVAAREHKSQDPITSKNPAQIS